MIRLLIISVAKEKGQVKSIVTLVSVPFVRILEADEEFWSRGGWQNSDINSLQDLLLLHQTRQVMVYIHLISL
jgi:hypothetical protein